MRLPQLLEETGFCSVEADFRKGEFVFSEGITLMLNRIEEIKDKVIQSNLATVEEISAWRTTFNHLLNQDQPIKGAMEQKMAYILARRG